MTWIAWRVQRLQYLVAAGAVAALTLWLAVSGLNEQSGWSQLSTTGDAYVLYALPGLLGLVLGTQVVAADIVRGTNRVARTQSITRARWLAGKLLVGGIASAGLVAALMPLLGWWIGAMNTGPAVVPKYFGITGRTSPASGQTWASSQEHVGSCFNQAQSQAALDHCAAAARLHFVFEYQPDSHYWALQSAETAIYLGLALVLAAVTLAAVRRWRA